MGRRWALGVAIGAGAGRRLHRDAGRRPVVGPADAAPAAPVGRPPSPRPAATPARPRLPERPPDATLAADGGDGVAGQLGSYTWRGAGSDSPWLPGTPIAVGAGEPLTVRIGGRRPGRGVGGAAGAGRATSDVGAIPVGIG